jgi:hypothetical protein
MRSAASAAHDLPSLVDSRWRKTQSPELNHGLGPVAVFFESSETPESTVVIMGEGKSYSVE